VNPLLVGALANQSPSGCGRSRHREKQYSISESVPSSSLLGSPVLTGMKLSGTGVAGKGHVDARRNPAMVFATSMLSEVSELL